MSPNKKNLLKSILTVNNAGSCSCGRPKLSDVYEPKPKPKPKTSVLVPVPQINPKLCCPSSTSNYDNKNSVDTLLAVEHNDDLTSTSFSFNIDTVSSSTTSLQSESETDLPRPSMVMASTPCPKITNSIAVVKDSNDPYQDFRHSMLQMIVERQIFSKDDLQELLQCFLELNSPCHHELIVKAFMEIWNQVVSKEIFVTVLQDQQEPCVVHGEKHGS